MAVLSSGIVANRIHLPLQHIFSSTTMTTEAFRNWQARSIEQRQASSAVMLGLSGGALAFSATMLDGQACYIGLSTSILFHLHGAFQALSVGAGVLFTINRTRDFAITASISRLRGKDPRDPKLLPLRESARKLGIRSKRLLFAQGILFFLATIVFIGLIGFRYRHALYPM